MSNLSIPKLEEKAQGIACQAVKPITELSLLAQYYFGRESIELDLPEREIYSPINFDE